MEANEIFPDELFSILASCGVRVLLIGRRALNVLGSPVMTTDYDVWINPDDIEKLNESFAPYGHLPNRTPEEARQRGRYVIENGERIDVLVARIGHTEKGLALGFDDAWARRQTVEYRPGLTLAIPSIPDLITTKRWSLRPRDLTDIEWLCDLEKQKP